MEWSTRRPGSNGHLFQVSEVTRAMGPPAVISTCPELRDEHASHSECHCLGRATVKTSDEVQSSTVDGLGGLGLDAPPMLDSNLLSQEHRPSARRQIS